VRPRDDTQQLLQCKNETITKCPTALTCGQTLTHCAAKGPVDILTSCPTGVSPGSLLFFAGEDSLIDIIRGHTPDPIRDCVNAIQELGACDQVEPQCNPANMKTCMDGVKDQCSRDCTNVLNQPCNAGPSTPTCDSLAAKEQQCKSDCVACASGP
jgi:hypothetical protein